VVEAITSTPEGGSLVTLKLMTSSGKTVLPRVGSDACFSIHEMPDDWLSRLPSDDPWTHQPEQPPAPLAPIEVESEHLVPRRS
jgi:hypothetical protein